MCWNKKVSLITFIVVVVLAIILFRRNRGADRHLAVFSAIFVTIQLLEFFAWLSLENKQSRSSSRMNDLITRLILIALWAQPLINSYMAYRDRQSNTEADDPLFNNTVKYIMIGLVLIFIVMIIIAARTATEKGSEFKTYPGERCHLVWSRKSSNGRVRSIGNGFLADRSYRSLLYMIGLFLPILLIRPIKKGIILAALGAILLIISRRMSSREEFGSWWCWIAGIFVVVALILKDPKQSKDSRQNSASREQSS